MSYKISLIKAIIKWTPKTLVTWTANFILKGIAQLQNFEFDVDARKIYAQIQLEGEPETIEVWLEDFAILSQEANYAFILNKAHSNKLWLNGIFQKIIGKTWKIPHIPQLAMQMQLMSELLAVENKET